jgi:hypothetical protein
VAAAPAVGNPGTGGPTAPGAPAAGSFSAPLQAEELPPPPPPPADAPVPVAALAPAAVAAPAVVAAAPAPVPASAPPPVSAAPAQEASPASAGPGGRTLAPATVQVAVTRQKDAFDRCVETARAEPGGEALVGRKIALLVAVGNGGRVEASEVEEADVEASALGSCLRRVAGRLLFPPFEGEPLGLRIPLQLGAPATAPAPP